MLPWGGAQTSSPKRRPFAIRSVMPVHVRSPPGGGVTAPFAYARADDRASIRQSDVSSCGRRDPALPRMGAAEGGAVLSGTACLGADSARTGGEERGPEEELGPGDV